MSKKGFTVWFTGWSGAGKTTLAMALEEELKKRNFGYVQRLDGDIVREVLCSDLGFSKEDRNENIKRATFVAELLSKNGVATLVSFISPYRALRDHARCKCHNFIEVYVKCDRDTLIERDVKGLYKKALDNEISDFTGISAPYEEPMNPEVVLDTSKEDINESIGEVIEYLDKNGLI
ncbi:adenylyl-sulfate kinase [Methanococcoides orientis]|uniref:adenylyl-sulfate kinase n=1 Tax=Methanococcoides orientis TaxID=2822137 RepID=UPI001E4EC3BF|nr:adenylyl-sulfate kinase [Methanococcoides orientis]UGV40312.1 adenylyl-sulfate kinase [Methanococcoides orientis]